MKQDHPKRLFDGDGEPFRHKPVLLDEVLQFLQPREGESYLDVTAGYGGHAAAIIDGTSNPGSAVLVDRDKNAVDFLSQHFSHVAKILHQDFLEASSKLTSDGMQFDMILADLGVSSPQLDNAKRGFSIRQNGPLDMRMDSEQSIRARDIINNSSRSELIEILRNFGEERKADVIVDKIISHRPIMDTEELALLVSESIGRHRFSKLHPATKTFQALRIAVNDEISQLQMSLPIWLGLLNSGGRIAVISFHSLEDRIVKQFLTEHSGSNYDAELNLLTKKPISAKHNELVSNPRARSAKLRAASKK